MSLKSVDNLLLQLFTISKISFSSTAHRNSELGIFYNSPSISLPIWDFFQEIKPHTDKEFSKAISNIFSIIVLFPIINSVLGMVDWCRTISY